MATMQTQVIGSGKYAIVAGLTWRPLGADPKTEIKQACKLSGSKFGLLFNNPDGRELLGLLPLTAPTKARSLPSGAAWLAAASLKPIILIKALPQGLFWVVQAGAGSVEYRADLIVSESEAAELVGNLLEDANGLPESERPLLALDGGYPTSHMVERYGNKEFRSFEDLVRGHAPKKAETVKQLVGITSTQILAVVVLAALVGAGMAGMKWWKKRQDEIAFEQQRAEIERQRLVAEQIANATEVRIAQAVVNAMNEDTATPAPNAVLRECLTAFRGIGLDIGGWRVTHLECAPTGNSVTVDLVLDHINAGGVGTNATLMDAAARRGWKPALDLSSGHAQLTIPLTAPANRVALKPIEAPPFDAVQARFVGRLQVLRQGFQDFSYALTNLDPRQAVYLDPNKENSTDASRFAPVPPDRSYRKGTFEVAGRSLWQMDSFSLDYPFVTLTKIELTASGNDAETIDWNVKGLYVSARP